ncbi:MAG: response regulator transcription factor [Chloroflexi bacterium]|nr:response regulator transcription factor [Chloroflexota bacterium]
MISVVVGEHMPLVRCGVCSIIGDAVDLELVGVTDNGERLLELVDDHAPDVVVTDFKLPRLGGHCLIKRLKETSSGTSVLVISEDVSNSCVMSCIEAGAAGYILKEASEAQLVNAIRGVYVGEAVIDLGTIRRAAKRSDTRMPESTNSNGLNLRELETLRLAARGLSNRGIAQQSFVSERTVHSYFRSMFKKMGVASRTEAIYHALANDWITLD